MHFHSPFGCLVPGPQRNSFDFLDKKAAFITGSSAGKHLTKVDYFNEVKSRLTDNYGMTHSAIFLTDEEKIKSGGYSVVVASWVKLLTDKRRRQIISELKNLTQIMHMEWSNPTYVVDTVSFAKELTIT